MKFPKDAPKHKVIKTFEKLGFKIVRMGNHISMIRGNPDGNKTPLTIPNHEGDKRLYIENYLQTIRNTEGGVS